MDVPLKVKSRRHLKDRNRKLKKEKALGITWSTAINRLYRTIIKEYFKMKYQMTCYRCGNLVDENYFHIDHKVSWLNSENPLKFYLDIDNIAVSHPECNMLHGSQSSLIKRRIAA